MKETGHKSRYFWLAAAVIWMVVIFGFSSQKADQSSEISGTLVYQIVESVSRAAHLDWKDEMILSYANMLEHPVRKAAHMTEYAIFACILLGNCMQYPKLQKKPYLWAELGAVFYAATDEFHQLFVDGRSCELKDVAIDSIGALLGLLIAWIVISIWNRFKTKKRKR